MTRPDPRGLCIIQNPLFSLNTIFPTAFPTLSCILLYSIWHLTCIGGPFHTAMPEHSPCATYRPTPNRHAHTRPHTPTIRLQLQPGQSKLVNFPVLPLINDGVIEITIVGESNVNSMRTVKRVKVKVSSPSWVYNTYSWSDYKVKRLGLLGLNRIY